jgi:hypothetical protein
MGQQKSLVEVPHTATALHDIYTSNGRVLPEATVCTLSQLLAMNQRCLSIHCL